MALVSLYGTQCQISSRRLPVSLPLISYSLKFNRHPVPHRALAEVSVQLKVLALVCQDSPDHLAKLAKQVFLGLIAVRVLLAVVSVTTESVEAVFVCRKLCRTFRALAIA